MIIDVKKGTTSVTGTSIADEINLKEPVGNGIVINALGGNDIINVLRGDKHEIKAGNGNDWVTVASGKDYRIDLGAGDDRLDLWGNSGHEVIAVSGNNTLNINSGSNCNINGGTGVDRLIVKGTNSNNRANLGAGQDYIGMATGTGNELHGGQDQDYIVVSGGTDSSFYGDEGDDTIRLYRGEGHKVYAGQGNDALLLTEANNCTIYGEAGRNQLMVFGGTGNTYEGGTEKDNITLKHKASGVTVNAGTGATVINIQAGDQHVINLAQASTSSIQLMTGSGTQLIGGEGKDVLRVWGDTTKLDASMGDGNDSITLDALQDSTIKGDEGQDSFTVGAGVVNCRLEGNYGNDRFYLKDAKDTFANGGYDHDYMEAVGGENIGLNGGPGNDTIILKDIKGRAFAGCDWGDDKVYASGTEMLDVVTYGGKNYIWINWDTVGEKNVIDCSYNFDEEGYSYDYPKERSVVLIYGQDLKNEDFIINFSKGDYYGQSYCAEINCKGKKLYVYDLYAEYIEYFKFQNAELAAQDKSINYNFHNASLELEKATYYAMGGDYVEGTYMVDNPFKQEYLPELVKVTMNV